MTIKEAEEFIIEPANKKALEILKKIK